MSTEKRIATLIDTFRSFPGISVTKAAKIAECTPKTVYNLAKTDQILGEILSNRPHTRPGPNKKQQIAPAGVSSLSDSEVDSAETDAFNAIRDILDDPDALPRDRLNAARALLSYCSGERKQRARQIIVDTTKVHAVEIKDGSPNAKAIDWSPEKLMDAIAVPPKATQGDKDK